MPSLKTSENIDTVQFEEQAAAPATPAAGFVRFYVNNTPQLAWRDDGGTIHLLVDGGAAGEIALADLASYARGSIIRGGAADWEAFVAKTLGGVLIGDGNDITLDTTPTFVGLTTHSAGSVQGTGGNTATFSATGDQVFAGSAGLQFAEIYVEGIDDGIVLAAQDTYYQVTSWSAGGAGIDGEANGAVPDVANDHITIIDAGMYLVTWNVSCYSTQKNEYEFEIFVNNGVGGFPNTESYRTTSVASAVAAISGSGICDFAAADTVELWVERKDGLAVAKTITIRAANINVTMIGGT